MSDLEALVRALANGKAATDSGLPCWTPYRANPNGSPLSAATFGQDIYSLYYQAKQPASATRSILIQAELPCVQSILPCLFNKEDIINTHVMGQNLENAKPKVARIPSSQFLVATMTCFRIAAPSAE
jgi:hypothetical protein